MNDSLFVLDANVFIEAHRRYYALDLCPGFWECLGHYGLKRQVLSIDRVRRELLEVPDALAKWVKETPGLPFVFSNEPEVKNAFEEMLDWVQKNRQFRKSAKEEFAKVADGWLAAYAKVHRAVVVTHEQHSPDAKRRVPLGNVCHQFKVPMVDTFSMLRSLEVKFDRSDCMTNWKSCRAVERNQETVGRAWFFSGTRIPVAALFENLRDGATIEQFLSWFSSVERWQIESVLDHEARALQE